MLNEERRRKLQEILVTNKRLIVNDVAEEFGISPVTIRKDLVIMENKGILTRVHGGAVLNQSAVTDLALTEKERIRAKDKSNIAQKAVDMIDSGDVVILDSGSTTTFIARLLKFYKNITIITNAVNIASELAASEIDIILTGGNLRENSFSLVGPLAEDAITSVAADKLFLGVDGIDLNVGLTTPNILETKVSKLMVNAASEVVVVTDSSKFGKRSLGVICQINQIHKLITDSGIPKEYLLKLEEMGIEVIIV